MPEPGPSPHLGVSHPARAGPSEHLTSDLGMLMVAAIPDKPTGGWISPPGASTPFVPPQAHVGGDPSRAGCKGRAAGESLAGSAPWRTCPSCSAAPSRALWGGLVVAWGVFFGFGVGFFFLFACFYPPSLSGRLLNIHNDLEGAAKVLASAECGGSRAKTRGRTVVSSHLQTIRLPLSRGGQCERTCAKHHVGKLSALRGTACWLRTNGNGLRFVIGKGEARSSLF